MRHVAETINAKEQVTATLYYYEPNAKPETQTSKAIIFINGIDTSAVAIDGYCNIIKNIFQDRLYKIVNVSNGFIKDFARATMLRLGGETGSSGCAVTAFKAILHDQNIEHVRVICHSEGSLVLKIALETLKGENEENFNKLYEKLSIVAIGPAFFFDETYAHHCENHVSLIDFVPFLLNITYIFSYINASWNLLWRKMRQDFTPVKIKNVYFYPFYSSMSEEHGLRNGNYANVFIDAITEFNGIGTVSTMRPQQSVSI